MDFDALERNYQPGRWRPIEQPKQASKGKKQKDFWTDQVSTGGGIAGSLGGAALGAGIGSIVPGFGTAIGGLIGGVLGGAAGSGAGEVAENAMTGEEDLFKNVGLEAALGGVSSLPPIRLARGIGGAIKGAASGGAKQGFEQGLTKTAFSGGAAQTGQPLKTSMSGRLNEWGNNALASQYGTIGKPTARANKPTETIGQLADMGIVKPQDAEMIAGAVTGSGGMVNKAVLGAVGGASRLDTGGLMRIVDDAIENHGIVGDAAKSIRQTAQAQIKRLQGGPNTTISGMADPNDALSVMKALEKRMADLRGRGGNYRLTDPNRLDQASVLSLLRDEVQDRLYTTAGANQNVAKVLTPELREQLVALNPGNAQWASYVDNSIMGAKSVGDLRSTMAPFVRISNIIDEGDINSMTFGGRGGNLFNALSSGGGVTSAIGGALANTIRNPIARAAGGTARTVSGMLPDASKGAAATSLPRATSPIKQATGGVLPLSLRQGVASGVSNIMSPETSATDPTSLTDALSGSQGTAGPPPGADSQSGNPYPLENLLHDMQRDPKHAEDFFQQYQMYQELFGGKQTELKANQQKQLMGSQAADGIVDQIEQELSQLGADGRIGGSVASFAGGLGLNDNVKTYQDSRGSKALMLIKAIQGSAGAVSDTDRAAIESAIPDVTDTAGERKQKIASLRGIINTYTNAAINTPASIEDALTATSA
jgi:hypothetical protein